jgi:hypothetical protein
MQRIAPTEPESPMRTHLSLSCLAALAALATLPVAAAELSPAQLQAAAGVYLGQANCDMKERVNIKAIDGQPGHFELSHRKARYTMVPEVTSTGAVRLEDRQAGVVWLQIPAKSMLLNAKAGRREVDGCKHAEQVAEAANPSTPSMGLGMAVGAATPAVASR